jgi:hypothetical protein
MNNKRVSTAVHVLLPAIVLLSLLVLVLPSSSAKAETKVNFPAPNIRATIGQAINKPTGDIYQSDPHQTGNISSLSSLSDLSSLGSLLSQIGNISLLSSLSDLSSLDSLLNQTGNISSLSSLSNLSELDFLLNRTGSISSLSSLSDPSGLNYGRNQISDISPMSKSAAASKKNIWLIVGPIAMVAVIAILADRFLTLRERKTRVPLTPTTGQNNEVEGED